MPKLNEVARFTWNQLPEHLLNNPAIRELEMPSDNYPLAAEMVWALLHAESLRQNRELWAGDSGKMGRSIIGMGVSQAISVLWPKLQNSEYKRINTSIRNYLLKGDNVKCIERARFSSRTKVPTSLGEWWIAEEYTNLTPPDSGNAHPKGDGGRKEQGAVNRIDEVIQPEVRPDFDIDDVAGIARHVYDYLLYVGLEYGNESAGPNGQGRGFTIFGQAIGFSQAIRILWPDISSEDCKYLSVRINRILQTSGNVVSVRTEYGERGILAELWVNEDWTEPKLRPRKKKNVQPTLEAQDEPESDDLADEHHVDEAKSSDAEDGDGLEPEDQISAMIERVIDSVRDLATTFLNREQVWREQNESLRRQLTEINNVLANALQGVGGNLPTDRANR